WRWRGSCDLSCEVRRLRTFYSDTRVTVAAGNGRAALGLDGRGRPSLHERQLDFQARIFCVALCRNAPDPENQRLEIFRTGVLARGRSGLARDVFFHQRSAVVVGASFEAKLRKFTVQLHPRDLDVIDRASEQDSGQGMDFEVLGERRSGARQPLLEQKRVLVDKAEGNEL